VKAKGVRGMLSRASRVLPFLLLLCTAARAQSSDPCAKSPPSDPAYYADMKEIPRGAGYLAALWEKTQLDDPAVPVVVRGLKTISSAKQHAVKVGCVELESRSTRAVKSVQLRWSVVRREADGAVPEGAPVLARGTLPPVEVKLQPGARQLVEVRGAHYADFLRPLLKASGEVEGSYLFYLGVARVEYADGTAEDLP